MRFLFLLCFMSSLALSAPIKETKQGESLSFYVNDGTVKKALEFKPSGVADFVFGALNVSPVIPDASPSVSGYVNFATPQSFAGVKTFTSSPVFPSISNGIIKTTTGVLSGGNLITNSDISGVIDGDKFQSAGAGVSGVVNSTTQQFDGDKTFNGNVTLGNSGSKHILKGVAYRTVTGPISNGGNITTFASIGTGMAWIYTCVGIDGNGAMIVYVANTGSALLVASSASTVPGLMSATASGSFVAYLSNGLLNVSGSNLQVKCYGMRVI